MPIHPAIASKFHLLEGIESFEAGLADPATRARLDEFMSITDAPAPPAVDVRDDAAPGPHGPVPVRIYTPAGAAPTCPAWSGCTAARSGWATWTCPRPTGPRGRSASGPAPSSSASTTASASAA